MQNLKMVDYLLLDYVCEYPALLDEIARPNVAGIMNKPPHGLKGHELIGHILELAREGLVRLEPTNDEYPVSFENLIQLVRAVSDISTTEVASGELPWNIYVKLTKKGGKIWESIFNPDWNRYSSCSIGLGEPEENMSDWILEQADKLLLQQYLAIITNYLQTKNKIRLHKIQPWQATYWKILEQAYRTNFIVIKDFSENMSITDRNKLNNLRIWRRQWKYPNDGVLELI